MAKQMDVQSLPDDILNTIHYAFLSMQGIAHLPSPSAAQADLWQRAWPWIQFMDTYYFCIPEAPTQDTVYAWCFALVANLVEPHAATSRRIMATPGVATLLGQAWTSFVRDPNAVTEIAFRSVGKFLFVSALFPPADFDEFIEGAGGEGPLADAVLQLIEYMLENSRSNHITGRDVGSILEFCALSTTIQWFSALLGHKAIPTMMSVLLLADKLMGQPGPDVYVNLFKQAWNVFIPLILSSDGYIGIAQAIDAGFLKFIISHAEKRIDWNEPGTRHLITHVLMARGTLYPSILSLLERDLPKVERATSTHAFLSSPLHADWMEFVELAEERIAVKNRLDDGDFRTYKACDNMACGKIVHKGSLKRCAGCEYSHYCNEECQLADWRADHRTRCATIRANGIHSVEFDGPTYCTSRDRAFLRALITTDYEEDKARILLERVIAMRKHAPHPVSTRWDYSAGRVCIDVGHDPEWQCAPWYAQAARSGGRMHINTVRVAENVGVWVLPMRARDSRGHDALRELAEVIPPETGEALPPDVAREVAELVEGVCSEVVEIL
ncbi:hypothetical protein C8R46DRAFT_1358178 [Mycena filopes]|nr:hypothetical protein C8R46DRAFT_1358178 [Mycena filopes]